MDESLITPNDQIFCLLLQLNEGCASQPDTSNHFQLSGVFFSLKHAVNNILLQHFKCDFNDISELQSMEIVTMNKNKRFSYKATLGTSFITFCINRATFDLTTISQMCIRVIQKCAQKTCLRLSSRSENYNSQMIMKLCAAERFQNSYKRPQKSWIILHIWTYGLLMLLFSLFWSFTDI